MSLAGRREGLGFWLRWAALRAFLAREREGVGLRVGERVVDDESLSEAEAEAGGFSGCGGGRGIMSSLSSVSSDEGGFMLAKESSWSSWSCEVLAGAMAFFTRR